LGWEKSVGFQSFPEVGTIRKFTAPADIMLDSPVIKTHQKGPGGFEQLEKSLLQDYKKPKNIESYVYLSQLQQAERIKTTIEANRRAMPNSMGSVYWQLNDCWPGITSSSTDYFGKKKALGYWIRNLYAMTLVSTVIEDKKLKVYVISDNLLPQKADLIIELIDFTGKSLMNKSISIEIPANTSTVVFDTALIALIKNMKTNEILLLTTLKSGNQVISENTLYFDSPKNLDLKPSTFQKQFTQIPEGYRVELSSDTLVKNVYLKMPFKGELPENYFDLIPGRPKILIYTTKTKWPDISNMVKIITLTDTY
jgi:beta-mannosidase